jgi:hypothetical protein
MKEDPNPLATLHPTARKVCRFFKGGMRVCRRGLLVAMLGLLACLLAFILFRGSGPGNVVAIAAGGCFWLACASVALCCVFYVLRLLVTALFFMRYSLGQLMGSILIYGTCMTLIVTLPFPWKGFPIVALAMLAFFIWVYILAHDPEDPWFTPAFVRKTLGPKQIDKDAGEQVKPADAGRTEGAIKDREATH